MGAISKKIFLPEKEEILERLKKADDGMSGYFSEKFYPLIAQYGSGRVLTTSGVILMLVQSINDFAKDSPLLAGVLYDRVPNYIDALIDDKGVAVQAKQEFAIALASVTRKTPKGN